MSDPSTPVGAGEVAVSRFVEFSRAEWAQLRAATPLPLTEPQLRRLVSANERMSLDEVADIYLPLSRLLNLYVAATQNLHAASATFLGTDTPRVPFVNFMEALHLGGLDLDREADHGRDVEL